MSLHYFKKTCLVVGLLLTTHSYSQNLDRYEFKNISDDIKSSIVKTNPSLFLEEPTLKSLDEIVKKIYLTDQFESVSIYYEKDKFIISADNFKTIAKISIRGNKKISQSEILQTFGISNGDKYNYQNVYDSAEKVKDLYGKNGYFNAIVNILPSSSSQGRIGLEIQIQENTTCNIKEIHFSTSYQDLNDNLQDKLKKYISMPLTEKNLLDVENAIKNYFTSNRIFSANIHGPQFEYNKSKTEVSLVYSLENPYRYVLLFDGNVHFSQTQLVDKLEIENRSQLTANPTAEFTAKLERLYRANGFSNVSIKAKESLAPSSFIRKVNFLIQEGPRTFVRNIKFNGTYSRSSTYYSDIFKNLYNTSVYDQEIVKKTQQLFLEELQNQGFLKARFISHQANFSDKKDKAELQFFLEEGPQTRIMGVDFHGAEAFSKQQLLNAISIQENTPINLTELQECFDRLRQFYTEKGFLDMEIRSELSDLIKYSPDNTKASLYFKIYEGPKVSVSRIVVEGNKKTHNSFIINELEFDIGELLTPQKIEDSEYHLQKTGLFSQVDITTIEKGTQVNARTILIHVVERDPGLFNFGLGANTEFEFTIRGYAGLAYNNLGGQGRAASIRGEIKQVEDINFLDHKITLGFLEPALFAKRTRGRVTFLRSREIISRTEDIEDQDAKILETNKLTFSVEKDFTRYFKVSHTLWSISTNKEFLFPNNEVIEKVNIASVGPILEYDRRDHPFVTRSGFYTKVSTEFGDENLGSTDGVHYSRNLGQINTYTPFLTKNLIWANSLSGGYLKNLKNRDTSHVPDVKEFKLGGRDTLRGFEPNEIPGDIDKSGSTVEVFDNSYYYLIKSEFRIPVYGQIETVLFYDGGAVYVKGFEFYENYRDSAGIGFRYQTPVGPLSIEYGHRLDRNKRDLDEPAGRFHLSFGTF